MNYAAIGCGALLLGGLLAVFYDMERPPVDVDQRGYRGLGMEQVSNPRSERAVIAANQVPAPQPAVPPGSPPSREVYQNVQVLGDQPADEFIRLMTAITEWVSPVQGCAYCHNPDEELSSDSLYTKVVARRMLQMTQHINQDWSNHVGQTGVTCYTCHRGKPVPANIWFNNPGPVQALGMLGNLAGQNQGSPQVAYASLPFDPFTPFLEDNADIRVIGKTALPTGNRQSIKQTEWSYGLMMHMSQSLGVNCTYCHNTRSFMSWDQSTPARAAAWYGIRMTRELNVDYLEPLGVQYPHARLGHEGDAPKASCATCHQGVNKPLYGVSMLKDYPELGATTAAK